MCTEPTSLFTTLKQERKTLPVFFPVALELLKKSFVSFDRAQRLSFLTVLFSAFLRLVEKNVGEEKGSINTTEEEKSRSEEEEFLQN